MEDKSNNEAQRPHTRWNPISLVSLLLCCKIAAVRYFIWALGLQMWAGREADSQAARQISSIYDFSISSHLKMFSCLFDVRWTSTIL